MLIIIRSNIHLKHGLFLLLFCCAFVASAQDQDSAVALPGPLPVLETDSLVQDTTPAKKRGFIGRYLRDGYPSPKKAITLAVVPGMGQIYNKKFWKLPIVYGALAGLVYAIDYNSRNYKLFRDIYLARTDNDETTVANPAFDAIPDNSIKAQRDAFDKNRQLSWIGIVGFYLITAGDAFVDAHLKGFNVDDDISWQPMIQNNFGQPSIGISLTIPLSR